MNRGVVIMTMTTRDKWDGKCRCRRHDGSLSIKDGDLSMIFLFDVTKKN
jgi:hypothetical protein